MRSLLVAGLWAVLASSAVGATPTPALAWEAIPGGRRMVLAPTGTGPGFTPLVPRELGIAWTNHLSSARYGTRQNLMNGAGVALADVDGDGWCDLFLCNKEGPSALYRNRGGWQFEEITERAGVAVTNLIATGAVFADFDGDGRPDLFVTSFLGPDALFLNLGEGRFTNVTAAAGVTSRGGTTSAGVADIDGDGDLDLYVCHFGIEAILRDGASITTRTVGGQPVVMGRFAKRLKIVGNRMIELGEPDVVYLNDGHATFTPMSWKSFTDEAGVPLSEAPPDFGLSVLLRDLDGDGTPDIYVCNDFQTPDRLWLGDGRGHFRAAPRLMFRNMSYASMGVDCADLERNGRLDLFTVEMLSRDHARNLSQRSPMDPQPRTPDDVLNPAVFARNVLQRARGDGTYAEVAWYAGVAMSDWSWTPIFLDVDLDGFEDLLVSNGHMHDVNDLDVNATRSQDPAQRAQETAHQILLAYPRLSTPKAAWRNRGNLTFEDRADAWHFNSTDIVHGMALADLDNDGDLDVVGNAWNAAPLICRNDSPAARVAVRLRGPPGNPDGIGAKVRLLGGAVPSQEQEMRASGRYLSVDQPQLTFAAGAGHDLTLEVRWRDGRLSRLAGIQPNCLYEVDARTAVNRTADPAPATATPWFTELAIPTNTTHHATAFDDFASQALLPWRLSHTTLGLASVPDGKGTLLVLGGSRGQTLQAIHIGPDGTTAPVPAPPTGPLPDTVTALAAVELVKGRISLLVAVSHFESGDPQQLSVLRFDRVDGTWVRADPLPPMPAVPGALATGDLDGDGDADLVVTGRFLPGRYPEPAGTRVYRNDAGRLVLDEERSRPLDHVGLVTGAALADFDGDGKKDLALACEWGPVRMFHNDGRTLTEVTAAVGLSDNQGLWQSLVVADFDGDGRPDLAVGNWGLNSFHQRAPTGPWELWYGDFDAAGRLALIEAYFEPKRQAAVPFRSRDTLATEIPSLRERFARNRAFGESTLPALLGDRAASAQSLRINQLASLVLYNRGQRFEAVRLPAQAQWTPVLGLAVGDFDQDGHPDLVAAQNFFSTRPEDDAMDAGQGLVLRNAGGTAWEALDARTSGVAVYGEQRAALAGDFDGDGKTDFALSQFSGPLKVFRRRP